jgi:DNA polymerase V
VFALVDGNNFYASCEQVFDPALRGRPLIVLSNNDGCAIARSAEAKALGIKMGQPIHLVPAEIRKQLVVRSANFALYGDMSSRVVSILRDAAPRVEVYSIDESFLDVAGIRDRIGFARGVRDRVRRWTGIPNCIGIGPTKTLAKLANKVAKKGEGVVDVTAPAARAAALEHFSVADLWGIGAKWSAKLATRGVMTAAHLRDAAPDEILGTFGVTMARTQRELQGHPCIELEEVEPDRKQIVVSRSFGSRVDEHEAVAQALATFAVRACEKLRRRGLVASGINIFVNSDAFRPELPQHHPSRTTTLPTSTSDSRVVLAVISRMFRGMLKKGIGYRKAGVMLLDLGRPEDLQGDLFAPATIGNPKLMATLDRINERFGRNAAGLGATGWRQDPAWGMRQQSRSPRYTTAMHELPIVNC